MMDECPKEPSYVTVDFRLPYTKSRERVGCCKLLAAGLLCSCTFPRRSGPNGPVNFQQDKCYSLFCNFLPAMKNAYLWEAGPGEFQAMGNILLQKMQGQLD